ncbi:Ig-like domain-containing protein [Salinibaculum rarum]|uniref:Ig-like domain-containing protein n=1 Tax=Salinibaculum rarum TaxID=3058903 RepID=UPI00265E6F09|nr:Ig-like domain-containing protein [Salinibaculum sp. KK48]
MRRPQTPRGQTAVIGFILVFGILMLLLVTLQTTAVPAWNQGAEFEHSQQVRDDLGELREGTLQAATTGRITSTSVQLGTRYPRRPFLLNPVDPSGEIQTTDTGIVEIENLTASGETGDYWTPSGNRSFQTRHISYQPSYNEYDNAPTTVLEHGVLYDRHGDRSLPLTGTTIVDGRRITLVTVNGTFSESGTRAESVTVEPVSAPQQVTTLEGNGTVRIRLPTRLDEETWTELLADEFVAEGGNVYDNVTVTPGGTYDTVTISLRGDQTYDLRLAKVRVGDGTGQPGPHYITTESPAQVRAPVGSAERVTFEVRDRYNNPVSGVPVTAAASGPGTLETSTATTDEDGHATFRYTASSSGEGTVEATFDPDATGKLETASITVDGTTAISSGGDSIGPQVIDIKTNQTTADDPTLPQEAAFTLTANVSDFARGGLPIHAVEWTRTAPDGTVSQPRYFDPADGAFDTVNETAIDTGIQTESWAAGEHVLSVRAQDTNGNWGPVKNVTVRVPGVEYTINSVDANASGGGNNIDVTFDISTTDSGAKVWVQSFENGTATKNEDTVDADIDPPVVTIKGENQADSIRISLLDSDGDVRATRTIQYPTPS